MPGHFHKDQSHSHKPDIFWNTAGGNLVICPSVYGLLGSYCEGIDNRLWFFSDDPTESEQVLTVGSSSRGNQFLRELWSLGITAYLDCNLAVPVANTSSIYLSIHAPPAWTSDMFFTSLPIREELERHMAAARHNTRPHEAVISL